jgi:hypothetical protein
VLKHSPAIARTTRRQANRRTSIISVIGGVKTSLPILLHRLVQVFADIISF